MNPFHKRATSSSRRPVAFEQLANSKFEQIHGDAVALEMLHRRLIGIGFSESKLPVEADRLAYCLLGDNQRPEIMVAVSPNEGELLEKAVINQPLARQSTPVLRMLAVIGIDLHLVRDLRDRIEAGIASALSADSSNFALYLPQKIVRGLEAQIVQITGYAMGCEWLLIRPDPVFGVRETLLESCGAHEFEIELPCASGHITIAGMNEHGQVLRKQLQLQAMSPWANISDLTGYRP